MQNNSASTKQIAGLKIKKKSKPLDKVLNIDETTNCINPSNTISSLDPSSQYQTQKVIQNTVKVSASLYSMNKSALNVYEIPEENTQINWNQMSDRKSPHVQKSAISMKSSVSIRPGNLSPGGIGCDIKHNSYDRYLARLKGSAPLRKEQLPADYGAQNVPFNPAYPVYGGKTVKTSIGSSNCTVCIINTPTPVPPLPTYTLGYSFIYTPLTLGLKSTSLKSVGIPNFSLYIPIFNPDNSFIITSSYQITNVNHVTMTVTYSFVNNDSLYDGLSFNNNILINGQLRTDQPLIDFYNNYTSNFSLATFGSILLSPAGYQFTGLNTLPLFSSDIPEIMRGSSLTYCFANIANGFGSDHLVSDYILSWAIINASDLSFMFYNSGINPTNFNIDFSDVDTMESMFELANSFNPDAIDMFVTTPDNIDMFVTTPTLQEMFQVKSSAKAPKPPKPPKPPKIIKKLFKNAFALATKKYVYYDAGGRPQMYRDTQMSQMSQMFKGVKEENNMKLTLEPVPPLPPTTQVDMSGMFYGCLNLALTSFEEFSMIALPIDTSYMFFNAIAFNAPLDNLTTDEITDISYMFSGATIFEQSITAWVLPVLISSVNAFSNSALNPEDIPLYFSFVYSFNYNADPVGIDFSLYIPILNTSGSFGPTLPTPVINIVDTRVTVTISSFIFKDNGLTNDGLTFNFNDLVNWYNNNTTGLTISKFAGMTLSRANNQFAGLQSLQITDPIGPSIVPNTSFESCFANTTDFNSDITAWNTSGVINMNSTFNNAAAFIQNLSNWNVTNVITYDLNNFAVRSPLYSVTAYYPVFIPLPTGFIYTFILNAGVTDTNFAPYAPIINNDGSFTSYTFTSSKTLANLVTIVINFTFTDNGVTNNGLSFINVMGYYNTKTTGLTITQFGLSTDPPNLKIPLSRGGYQFTDDITLTTTALKISATDTPYILPNTSLNNCFFISSFNSNINNWDTTNVINMNYMFSNIQAFNQPLNSWVTTNVKDMSFMFNYASNFNQPLNNWVTTNVTNMSNMFHRALNFNQPLNNWVTTNVTDMSNMFQDASNFNQPLNNWVTTNVTNMSNMFQDASNFNQPLNNWVTTNVTDMSNMFNTASIFNQDISGWVTSNVTNMDYMFNNAITFDQDIHLWPVGNVTTHINFAAGSPIAPKPLYLPIFPT